MEKIAVGKLKKVSSLSLSLVMTVLQVFRFCVCDTYQE